MSYLHDRNYFICIKLSSYKSLCYIHSPKTAHKSYIYRQTRSQFHPPIYCLLHKNDLAVWTMGVKCVSITIIPQLWKFKRMIWRICFSIIALKATEIRCQYFWLLILFSSVVQYTMHRYLKVLSYHYSLKSNPLSIVTKIEIAWAVWICD